MTSWPIFQPQDSASDLADHPHRFTLLAGSEALRFPPLCPNCDNTASGSIAVQKVFRDTGSGDSVTRYVVHQMDVPYCDDCKALHHREQRLLTPQQRVVVSLATGLSVSAFGCVFMALVFLPAALKDLGRGGFPLPLVVVACFAMIAWSSFSGAWTQNAHRRVAPQTSITLAFDFSEGHAPFMEAMRRTYAIRNAAFANAFISLNQRLVR